MKITYPAIAWLLIHAIIQPAHADSRADLIIRAGEKQMRGLSTQAVMTMVIHRPSFQRELKIRSWTVGNDQALVEILQPHKEMGVSSLRVSGGMWNYLPNTDQVVRVPTSLMLQPWMGSDFSNDDLMKASSLVRDYTHQIAKTVKFGKENIILVKCLPKPNAPVVWGRIDYWARASDSLPVREDYYDEKGLKVKMREFSGFKRMDDRTIPTVILVRKPGMPEETTKVVYEKILFDRAISRETFNRLQLRERSQKGVDLAQGWQLRFLHPRILPKFGYKLAGDL